MRRHNNRSASTYAGLAHARVCGRGAPRAPGRRAGDRRRTARAPDRRTTLSPSIEKKKNTRACLSSRLLVTLLGWPHAPAATWRRERAHDLSIPLSRTRTWATAARRASRAASPTGRAPSTNAAMASPLNRGRAPAARRSARLGRPRTSLVLAARSIRVAAAARTAGTGGGPAGGAGLGGGPAASTSILLASPPPALGGSTALPIERVCVCGG